MKLLSQRGFTLTELLVALAVALILAGLALPTFESIVQANRLRAQLGSFVAALKVAKSEAIARSHQVVLCPSVDQRACGAVGTPWESGWVMFADADNDGSLMDGELVLRVNGAMPATMTLRGMANAYGLSVIFRPVGTATEPGMFVLCIGGDVAASKAVTVSAIGRISIASDSNHNKIPEDASGTDIATCNL